MKRQAAFVNVEKHLKGALHCHTTRSDGSGDPADVIRMHAENGYDFMAMTDHRYYNYANYGDTPMLIVPGMEMDGNFDDVAPSGGVHCHHIVCIGPARSDGNGFEQDERMDGWRMHVPEDTQPYLDKIHAKGNMTIYCHPEWSGTAARDFETLRGNFAMEIWNSGCAIEDRLDTNAAYWDELLVQGQRIYGVATDDGHAMYQHCNGWVMVNSKPELNAILAALKDGAFYSSCGPQIHDFYVKDGKAYVECSPVVEIGMRHMSMPYGFKTAEAGETITSGEFKLRGGRGAQYVRAVVMDAQGRRAWTNPIFLEDGDIL